MSNGKDLIGALFFWDDGTATGYLTAGEDRYELAGVRRSDIRTDFEGRKVKASEPQSGECCIGRPHGAVAALAPEQDK